MNSIKQLLAAISLGTTLVLSGCGAKKVEEVKETSSTTASSINKQNNDTSSTAKSGVTESVKYKDGTYTGSARGFKPDLSVSVTVKNNEISEIQIVSHNESEGYFEKPFEIVPKEIIAAQSTAVDVVSGATKSSNGIMAAVENALKDAKI